MTSAPTARSRRDLRKPRTTRKFTSASSRASAHFAQRGVHVGLGQLAAAAQLLKYTLQSIGKGLKHGVCSPS